MTDVWTADRIRAYLLAQLDESSLAEAEERLLTDDVFARELEVVETELVDDYATGRLSPADRAAFEHVASERPRLQERVAFARTLAQRSAGEVSPRTTRRTWLAVAAAVACLATGAWLVWQLGAADRSAPLSVESPTPAPAPSDPPAATPGPPDRQVQAPPPTPAPQVPVQRATPPVFAVLLSPAMTRGTAPQVVRVPAGVARVLLRVPVAAGETYRTFRLTLRNEDDRVVARADTVRPTPARELELLVDAARLPERAELHVEGLDGVGQPTDLAYLPLDIRR
jgi:hypothetical protein